MAFVSVTRLRLRSFRFLPFFFLHATRAQRQVRASDGFLGGSLLSDRNWTFWTLTVWADVESMRTYMTSGAHRVTMPKLFRWCDEASVAHWSEADGGLPSWQEAETVMRRDGRPSKVRHPSADHAAMTFASPRSYTGQAIVRA